MVTSAELAVSSSVDRQRRIVLPIPIEAVEGLDEVSLWSFRPVVNREGYPQIIGIRINVPYPEYQAHGPGRHVTFEHPEAAECNKVTLAAVAAVLQDVTAPQAATLDWRSRAIPQNDFFHAQLKTYIQTGGKYVRELPWDERKISFYLHMQGIWNQAAMRDPYSCWVRSLPDDLTDRRMGIFAEFLPQFASLLEREVSLTKPIESSWIKQAEETLPGIRDVWQRLTKQGRDSIPVGELMTTMTAEMSHHVDTRQGDQRRISGPDLVRATLLIARLLPGFSYVHSAPLAMEIAIMTNQYPETIKIVADLITQGNGGRLMIVDWLTDSRSLILGKLKAPSPAKAGVYTETGVRMEQKTNPEAFGLTIDARATQFVREHCGLPDAIVITRESIIKNHEGYWRYQRALTLEVARSLGIDVRRERLRKESLPLPRIFTGYQRDTVKRQIGAFRTHERVLKRKSDWLWLWLREDIQKVVIEKLAYCGVPPYCIDDAGVAVPAHSRHWRGWEIPTNVVNDLPFLNEARLQEAGGGSKRYYTGLAIAGEFVSGIQRLGGWSYLDHATARWYLSHWGLATPLDPRGYSGRYPELPPPMDVDMLCFGADVGRVARDVGKMIADMKNTPRYHTPAYGAIMKGESMTGTEYGFVAKPIGSRQVAHDPWLAAHDKMCVLHAIRAWPGRETYSRTNLLIQTLFGLSRFRSMGLVTQTVSVDGKLACMVKALDLLCGGADYAEASGGVDVAGVMRTVHRFTSLSDAFTKTRSGAMSVWLMTRTIGDVLWSGGVIFPEADQISPSYGKLNSLNLAKEGAATMRNIELELGKKMPQILESLSDMQRHDLRTELAKGAADACEGNPYDFLVLCSGPEVRHDKRGLQGIEFSIFYPNLHTLRQNKDVWVQVIAGVSQKLREQTSLKGMELVASVILKIPEARVLIQRKMFTDFLRAPALIGEKLMARGGTRIPQEWDTRDWGVLHEVLGGFAAQSIAWRKFVYAARESNLQFQHIDQVLGFMRQRGEPKINTSHGQQRYGEESIRNAEELNFRRKILIDAGNEAFIQRQNMALIDWLVDPGF